MNFYASGMISGVLLNKYYMMQINPMKGCLYNYWVYMVHKDACVLVGV